MNASLRIRVALHADGLARSFAGAGVGLGALAAHGQSPQVADAAVAFDTLKAFQVHTDFAAQITFDDVFAILDRVHDLGQLRFGQVFRANGAFDTGFFEDRFRVHRADPVNVTERNIDSFLARNINT